MTRILLALVAALFVLPAFAADPKPVAIDGDTLALGAERIRIVGLDTPETYQPNCPAEAALGYQAAGRLQHLINARSVRIERTGTDKYRRTLAKVYVGGEDVAAILIREGLAIAYDGHTRRTHWATTLCHLTLQSPRGGYLR